MARFPRSARLPVVTGKLCVFSYPYLRDLFYLTDPITQPGTRFNVANHDMPSIHHVQIAMPAGGEDRARTFYGELIGLREIEKPDNLKSRGGVWFESRNLQVHLGVDKSFSPTTKAHVAFRVRDLQTLRERLRTVGVDLREDEPLPGYDRCYVVDPFGNRLELLTPNDPAANGWSSR